MSGATKAALFMCTLNPKRVKACDWSHQGCFVMCMFIPCMVTCQPCVDMSIGKDMLSAREAVLQGICFQHPSGLIVVYSASKAYTMSYFAFTTNYKNT